jgi:hypothetical protein
VLADDEVVECLDTEQRSGCGQAPRQGDVLGRRLGIAARVVVGQDDGRGAGQVSGLETLAQLCCGRSYVA